MKVFRACVVVCIFLSVNSVHSEEIGERVIGRWLNSNESSEGLEFYGSSVGRETTQNTKRYLHYSLSGENSITFTFGAGETAVYTLSFANSQMVLAGADDTVKTYDATAGITNACINNLHQLAGAQALFRKDNPYAGNISPPELVPLYIDELPTCPEGGVYMLEGPACSILSHSNEE